MNACALPQMHLKVKANTFMNKPLIMNKIHYIIVRNDLVHVHANVAIKIFGRMNMFS